MFRSLRFFITFLFAGLPLALYAIEFPSIVATPSVNQVTPGTRVVLTAKISGVTPISYMWLHNGVFVEGAAGAELVIPSASVADAGVYQVQTGIDAHNSTASGDYSLAVIGPTSVAGDRSWAIPAKSYFVPGESRAFSVRLSSSFSWSSNIQWYKNGLVVPGATGISLLLPAVAQSDIGTYTFVVDGVTSSAGNLLLPPLPQIERQPQSTWSANGGSADFSVLLMMDPGTYGVSYQWYKDNIALPGATMRDYRISQVNSSSYGEYKVRITNPAGYIDSAPAHLVLYNPPTILTQPAPQVVAVDGTLQLSVKAGGAAEILPLTYQWEKNSVAVPGAISATLTVPNAQEADAGMYRVRVSGNGGYVTSTEVAVTVGFVSPLEGAPAIVGQPADESVTEGTSVTFEVGVSGATPLSYQWRKNGATISGATESKLTLSSVTLAAAGTYSVSITNSKGSVVSRDAKLTVQSAPTDNKLRVVNQPQSVAAIVGDTVVFSFTLNKTATISVNWLKDSWPIVSGTTSQSLTLTNVQLKDAGSYSAIISNLDGTIQTLTASLSFQASPQIQIQPRGTLVTAGETLVLGVIASGNPGPTYQWQQNNIPIAGATGSSLSVPNVTSAAAGQYRVVVTNAAGSVTSDTVTVTVSPRAANAGIYYGHFGVTGTGGDFAVVVNPDGTCLFIGYFTGEQKGFVAHFALLADGSFQTVADMFLLAGGVPKLGVDPNPPVTAKDAATAAVSGLIAGGSVQGQFSGGPTFSAAVSSGSGPSQGIAGAYSAPVINTANGMVYSVVMADGQVLLLSNTGSGALAGLGTISAAGAFSVQTTSGAQVNGSIDSNGKTVTGNVSGTSGTPAVFTGVSDSQIHTDRLVNVSTRGYVGTGADVLIAGFIVEGNSPQDVLIRAVGPTLTSFGVTGTLTNPTITVFKGDTKILSNDDWAGDPDVVAATKQLGAFDLPIGSRDSALFTTLAPGGYTVQVAGGSADVGVALVEVYDGSVGAFSGTQPHFINISTRGHVGTGDQQMIAGFIVSGNSPKKVLIRAVGPTLKTFGVDGFLADPKLVLYNGSMVIAQNDNWSGDTQVAAATSLANVFPLPTDSKDAAIVTSLAPGGYTVVVSGVSNTAGIALVEVYELPE